MKNPKPIVSDPRAIPKAEIADIAALKALVNGQATEEQQKRFFSFLIHHVCAVGDEQFYPGASDSTAFALGKRRVATYLLSYATASMERFTSTQETGR